MKKFRESSTNNNQSNSLDITLTKYDINIKTANECDKEYIEIAKMKIKYLEVFTKN